MNAFALDVFNGNVHRNIKDDARENPRSAVNLMRWPLKFALIFGYWPFVKHLGNYTFQRISLPSALVIVNFVSIAISQFIVKTHAMYMFLPIGKKTLQFNYTRGISLGSIVMAQNIMVLFLLATTALMRKDILLIWDRVRKIHSACRIHCGALRKYRRSRAMMSLVVLVLLATSRAGFGVATVVGPTFYRLEMWRALMCVIAFFVWNLITGLVSLWVVIITGYIDILAEAVQMLNDEMRFRPDGTIQYIKSAPESCIIRMKRCFALKRELRETVELINDKFQIPLVVMFIFTVIILTVSIFFTANDMNWENGFIHIGIIPNFFTVAIYIQAFHFVCSAGTEFVAVEKRFADSLLHVASSMPTTCMRTMVNMEAMKAIVTPTVFSPGYYYRINNCLMSSIAAAISSYSIILLQFNQAEENHADCSIHSALKS